MYQLSLRRFAFILSFQLVFIVADIAINSFSYLARGSKVSIIFLFLVQDALLLLSMTALIFSLYSTYIYQTGLADLIYRKFRSPLVSCVFYFLLCVTLHAWIVIENKSYALEPKILTALFIIQRLFSPIYYYFYKRSALRLSDPRFYNNLDWVTEQLSIK